MRRQFSRQNLLIIEAGTLRFQILHSHLSIFTDVLFCSLLHLPIRYKVVLALNIGSAKLFKDHIHFYALLWYS